MKIKTYVARLKNFQFYNRSSSNGIKLFIRTIESSFNSIIDLHILKYIWKYLWYSQYYNFQFYNRSSFLISDAISFISWSSFQFYNRSSIFFILNIFTAENMDFQFYNRSSYILFSTIWDNITKIPFQFYNRSSLWFYTHKHITRLLKTFNSIIDLPDGTRMSVPEGKYMTFNSIIDLPVYCVAYSNCDAYSNDSLSIL